MRYTRAKRNRDSKGRDALWQGQGAEPIVGFGAKPQQEPSA